jgi:hypothetical protein
VDLSAPTGYLIEVEDRGLGMSDEQLAHANERTVNPPVVDLSGARSSASSWSGGLSHDTASRCSRAALGTPA